MPSGENLSAIFRQGTGKRYERRPPANCVAARAAWDHFSTKGDVEWLQLLDGYWGAQIAGQTGVREVEAIEFRRY
jgi:hypothetical protein